jgi:hypothetical protein
LDALLGTWSGHSVTRRSGSYGSTLVEEDTLVNFTLQENGSLIQVSFHLSLMHPSCEIQTAAYSLGEFKLELSSISVKLNANPTISTFIDT